MKIRRGFVGNSSSSSFTVKKRFLTPAQIEIIYDHINYAKENFFGYYTEIDDWWNVHEKGEHIMLSTIMDNFDMYDFLLEIGVPEEAIESENRLYW